MERYEYDDEGRISLQVLSDDHDWDWIFDDAASTAKTYYSTGEIQTEIREFGDHYGIQQRYHYEWTWHETGGPATLYIQIDTDGDEAYDRFETIEYTEEGWETLVIWDWEEKG